MTERGEPQVLLVAHRSPVTAAGCARLAEAGATIFEIDLQLWDERVIVSHYLPTRIGGRRLRRERWRFRWRRDEAREPELARMVEAVPAGGRVLLDLKESAPDRRSRLIDDIDEITHSLGDRSRFLACTPVASDLQRLRASGFRTWRTVGDRRQLAAVLADGPLPDDAVTADHRLLTASSVEALHSVVPLVVAWTVNDVRRALQLRAWGVDGVTTDRVAVLHALADAGA